MQRKFMKLEGTNTLFFKCQICTQRKFMKLEGTNILFFKIAIVLIITASQSLGDVPSPFVPFCRSSLMLYGKRKGMTNLQEVVNPQRRSFNKYHVFKRNDYFGEKA